MRKTIGVLWSFLFLVVILPHHVVYAESFSEQTFLRGKIVEVSKKTEQTIAQVKVVTTVVKVLLLEGQEKNTIIKIEQTQDPHLKTNPLVKGEEMIVNKIRVNNTVQYVLYEPYRLPLFWYVFGFFLLFLFGITGKTGIRALGGLGISLLVIGYWVIPGILKGTDPLQTCLIGVVGILFASTYIAHGFSLKSTIAIVATSITLFFATLLSMILVPFLQLFGLGNEDIYLLQVGSAHLFNTQGLLLGSMLIGMVGALNDITTTQVATIFAFAKYQEKQTFAQLFSKSMQVGKEHSISLINTLVLAYAGSSFAVFLFLALNPNHLPWWIILNNETTMEEILKSIVGSSALLLAIPLTTFLASVIALQGTTSAQLFHRMKNWVTIQKKEQEKYFTNARKRN